jgi:hypothetical protein
MNAPGGRPDRSITPSASSLIPGVICNIVGGELIPCTGTAKAAIFKKGQIQLNEITDFFKRQKAGKPAVDPLPTTRENYLKQLDKLGLTVTPQGKVVPKNDPAAKAQNTAASSQGTP